MTQLLHHPFTEALATSLLHSLWMFPLAIGVAWLIGSALREARHRYRVFLGGMLSLPVVFLVTLWSAWHGIQAAWADAALLGESLGSATVLDLTEGLSKLGLSVQPTWMAYLTLCYLTGLLAALALNLYRYAATRRARKGGLLPPPEYRDRFAALQREVVPGKNILWKVSERVGEVLVIGVLRPVILFPIGLLNVLSVAEVEALLRHELAHIRRNDPLWNAVQQLILSLFFYHPLVYWLARRIDTEREYACDDLVSRTTDKTIYAGALVRVAKYSLQIKHPFTMAAIDRNTFTQRIHRLFNGEDPGGGLRAAVSRRTALLAPLGILPLCLLFAYQSGDNGRLAWLGSDTPIERTAEELVTGHIVDGETKLPLIGATVTLADKSEGTITDFDGKFELRLPAGTHNLLVSYVGYTSAALKTTVGTTEASVVRVNLFKGAPPSIATMTGSFRIKAAGDMETSGGGTRVSVAGSGNDSSGSFSKMKADGKILFLVDGKRVDSEAMDGIDPGTIQEINVIKVKEKIAAYGYGTDYTGVVEIILKK